MDGYLYEMDEGQRVYTVAAILRKVEAGFVSEIFKLECKILIQIDRFTSKYFFTLTH